MSEQAAAGGGKSFGNLASELLGLVLAYAKQETIEPIKALGRFVAFGVAGALLIAVGGSLLTLGAVRAVQSEAGAHVTGNLDWTPYVAGILVAGIGAAWAVSRIAKGTASR